MDSLLSLDGGGEASDQKKKKALPPHITTPRKGPLLLQKLQITKSPQQTTSTELPSYLIDKGQRFKYQQPGDGAKLVKSAGVRGCGPPRHGFLTRYPIAVVPRPMDAIEDQLQKREMTWSQLKYNVQLMMVSFKCIKSMLIQLWSFIIIVQTEVLYITSRKTLVPTQDLTIVLQLKDALLLTTLP